MTADLTAIGESILYLLQIFSSGTDKRIKNLKVVIIRCNCCEIENIVKGSLEINQLQDMITEIRRHYTTLCNRMEDLEVHMGWSHANANNRYMLLVKDLAVKAIDQPSTARSSDRNIIEDPLFITSHDNLLPDMNMETNNCEQGMEILITLIKTLPFSPYPMNNYFFLSTSYKQKTISDTDGLMAT